MKVYIFGDTEYFGIFNVMSDIKDFLNSFSINYNEPRENLQVFTYDDDVDIDGRWFELSGDVLVTYLEDLDEVEKEVDIYDRNDESLSDEERELIHANIDDSFIEDGTDPVYVWPKRIIKTIDVVKKDIKIYNLKRIEE